MDRKKATIEKLFICGLILIVSGSAMLLLTTGKSTTNQLVLSLLLIIPGLLMLYTAYIKKARDIYVLLGNYLCLTGIYLLLRATIIDKYGIEKLWPFFMLIAGVSLIPYALRKPRSQRVRIFVPAITIIILSLLFLLFSLDFLTVGFKSFAAVWWPLLIIIMGIILIIIFLIKNYAISNEK